MPLPPPPPPLQASIMLTHWGRMDPGHRSNTAFTPDNYTQEYVHRDMQPQGWLRVIQGHPCYLPGKVGPCPPAPAPCPPAAAPLPLPLPSALCPWWPSL